MSKKKIARIDIDECKVSGLETVFLNCPGSKVAGIQVWFRAGSALEDSESQGIAHFLEHMFFKTRVGKTQNIIAEEIERLGGEINAFTSFDYTCYYINCPNQYLKQCLQFLLEMVSQKTFLEEDLIPERGVVFEEYRRTLDRPGQISFLELQKKCFKGNYQHPILGKEKTIKKFNLKQLMGFRKKFYNKQNALLIVSGNNCKKEKLVNIVRKHTIPAGSKNKFDAFQLKSKSKPNIYNDDVRMAKIVLLFPSAKYADKEGAHEDLAINCLGHGESSVFHRKFVLGKALSNQCSGSTMFFKDGGAHFISFGLPTKNIDTMFDEFPKLIADVRENGLEKSEVQKIKNQYVASKIYERETLESFTFNFGFSWATTGNIYGEDQFLKNIEEADLADVNKALRDIFSRKFHIQLVLPKGESPKDYEKQVVKLENISKQVIPKKKVRKYKISEKEDGVKVVTLRPGIKLTYRQNVINPTFVFQCYLKGGLYFESDQTNGAFNLISSILTKGYKDKKEEDVKFFLEEKSATLSGFSGKNAYGLNSHGMSKDFEEILNVFFNSLLHSNFSEENFEHERELVYREMEVVKEDPIKICFENYHKLIYTNHPYHRRIIGQSESVSSLNVEQLKNIHNKNVGEEEILFTYCGDKDLLDVIKVMEDHLGTFPDRVKKKKEVSVPEFVYGKMKKIPLEREQCHIMTGLPAYHMGEKEEAYIKLLTVLLSGQSSELFLVMRDERGLCYTVSPVYSNSIAGSYWGIYIACGKDKVQETFECLESIISRLEKSGVSDAEFVKAKKIIDGQFALDLQTNEDYASFYSVPEYFNLGTEYPLKMREKIKVINRNQFNRFIKKYLSQKRNTILVGPQEVL